MTILKIINKSVKHWYMSLIIGLMLIALGVYVFSVPLATYITLSILFSISFLIIGISETIFAFQNRRTLEGWGWYLTGGLIDLTCGVLLIIYPEISITSLPFIIGFTLMFRSFQGLGFAFDLKSYGEIGWGNVALASVLGILFSILLLAHPLFTSISLVTLTALSFIFGGIGAVALSFSLKKLKDNPNEAVSELNKKIDQL